MRNKKPRVLYVVYWGAAEPLGQSLVVPAVKRLASLGVDIDIVTFEKRDDLAKGEFISSIRADLEKAGVRWTVLRYHKAPKVPATLFDVANGVFRALLLSASGRFDIVHGRTFIGGLMGMIYSRLTRAKFVYHNEGFYPDEQVDGGVWAAGSKPHRLAKWLEAMMYSTADAIITMSRRGRRQIESLPTVERRHTPVEVVPSCVDLQLFNQKPRSRSDAVRFVYSGSVGGRYILDRVARFVYVANRTFDRLHLQVLSRAERALIGEMLTKGGLDSSVWSLEGVPYSSMPARLHEADAGLFFLSRGLSEHGCSPTKVGEYWAMGLPVVTTPNVSDLDEIILQERVGVIVAEHTDDAYSRAALELKELLADSELWIRCRRAAERYYSLEAACDTQAQLYEQLIAADPVLS